MTTCGAAAATARARPRRRTRRPPPARRRARASAAALSAERVVPTTCGPRAQQRRQPPPDRPARAGQKYFHEYEMMNSQPAAVWNCRVIAAACQIRIPASPQHHGSTENACLPSAAKPKPIGAFGVGNPRSASSVARVIDRGEVVDVRRRANISPVRRNAHAAQLIGFARRAVDRKRSCAAHAAAYRTHARRPRSARRQTAFPRPAKPAMPSAPCGIENGADHRARSRYRRPRPRPWS